MFWVSLGRNGTILCHLALPNSQKYDCVRSAIPVRVLAPELPPSSEYAGPWAGPNWATLHTQFVPGGAQGAGPGFPCQNEVLINWPSGLPHPQRWLDIILGALWGGSGGWGRGSRKSLNFGREKLDSMRGAQGAWFAAGPFLSLLCQLQRWHWEHLKFDK